MICRWRMYLWLNDARRSGYGSIAVKNAFFYVIYEFLRTSLCFQSFDSLSYSRSKTLKWQNYLLFLKIKKFSNLLNFLDFQDTLCIWDRKLNIHYLNFGSKLYQTHIIALSVKFSNSIHNIPRDIQFIYFLQMENGVCLMILHSFCLLFGEPFHV